MIRSNSFEKVQRVKTGVPGLDFLLQGGVPRSANVLLMGAPGSGKTTLSRQIVYNSLKRGMKVIYITTSEPPSNIKKQMDVMGWPIQKEDKIIFIDCYSWRISNTQREDAKYQLSNINRLNELDQLFRKALEEIKMNKDGIVIFDSLSDLLLHTEEKSVFKLVQLITGRIKAVESNGIFLIESGIHDERQVATINYIMDGTIEMRIYEDRRQMRIKRMTDTVHPLQWIDFEIKKGVELEVKNFFK